MTHHVPSYPGSPHEDHWPSYDPIGPHHHPKHPPYMIDRCADECDDQLPLFSQVGRGLEGEGYRVVVSKDNEEGTETELSGYYRDPHTGELVYDWTSENINGGRLYYSYHIRNFTDPQTFTITFRYVRPNRDADEEGTVWSWTSPAIPYVGDEDMGDLIASWVSTLYLRKKGENWNWRKHEKLVYPEGMTHQSVNAPGPEEGWTVNLTYGIDEDCDIVVPTVEDLAKIIGMDPDEIYNLVKRGLPSDVIPDGMNVKQYIDSITKTYDVKSGTPNLLSVAKETVNKLTTFTLKVLLGAGAGIELVKNNQTGNMDIAANLEAGPGIQIGPGKNNSIKITNASISDDWITLRPGIDYDFEWHNGWYAGEAQTGSPAPHRIQVEDRGVPQIRVIASRDTEGNILTAQIRVRAYGTLQNTDNLLDMDKFYFAHSSYPDEAPCADILSFTFKGDWKSLNNLKPAHTASVGVRVWNVKGTNVSRDYSEVTNPNTYWHQCGASWDMTTATAKNDGSDFPKLNNRGLFIVLASAISDGWNSQYGTPDYGYNTLCIRPWANWTNIITLT